MLEWKKQLFKKRRYSTTEINDQTNLQQQSDCCRCIQQMMSHFKKLFCYLIRIKNHQSIQNCSSIIQIPALEIKNTISQKNQYKMLSILYLRLKNMLSNFQYQLELHHDFDQIFDHIKNSQHNSIIQFFKLCCFRVVQEINAVKNQSKRKQNFTKQQKLDIVQKKCPNKIISQNLCQTIYNILDLERVQACMLFIEGLNTRDNTNFVYDKQRNKNKKIKKQYNCYYFQYFNNRLTRLEKQKGRQIQSVYQRQKQKQRQKEQYNQSKIRLKTRSSITNQNNNNQQYRRQRQPIFQNSINKLSKISTNILKSSSASKSVVKALSMHKQRQRYKDKERDKVKLQPIYKKKNKLKLIK